MACDVNKKGFHSRLLISQKDTDELKSYGVVHGQLTPEAVHDTSEYANNWAEQSPQPTRVCKRGMRRFKLPAQAQKFLPFHAALPNLFNLRRYAFSASNYPQLRACAFETWIHVTA